MTSAKMRAFEGTGQRWNELVAGLPGAHLLQTWEWAQVKAAYGWRPMPFVWSVEARAGDPIRSHTSAEGQVVAAAMILRRAVLSRGFVRRMCMLYVPKGPVLHPTDADLRMQVLRDLENLGRREGAILVKLDPDVELGKGDADTDRRSDDPAVTTWQAELVHRGWEFSNSQVQFRNSVIIELSPPLQELLQRMKPKTRYNIGLAERKGVTVRSGDINDVEHLYRMYAETANRDGFVIRDREYYSRVWTSFLGAPRYPSQPAAEALVAEVEGEAVAALWLFHFAQRSYYLYGMSSAAHREKMPNYLLQWRAIQRSQELGCRVYDLWGAPDRFDETDPMWGVFRFKEGLGGDVVRTIGAWDYPSGGAWYGIYSKVLPRVLDVMRWRGRRRVREVADGA
ncbi:MAG TPA: peptidoglycan bridge formation glycyltransferase FemA/FemB family protein [Anaerolineales bacterium]|nr:peptidoglycan bridge formation glycyltransferase FemA/FemB family protein [Anaerolineales bacterium]